RLLVVVPALPGLEYDDPLQVDAALGTRLDEPLDGPERVPPERKAALLAVAHRDEPSGAEYRGGARGVARSHLAREAEEPEAADRENRGVERGEDRRDVDQLVEVARVAGDVDGDAAGREHVAVLGDAVARRHRGHVDVAAPRPVPPAAAGHPLEAQVGEPRVQLR